jgi:hypothetical protein
VRAAVVHAVILACHVTGSAGIKRNPPAIVRFGHADGGSTGVRLGVCASTRPVGLSAACDCRPLVCTTAHRTRGAPPPRVPISTVSIVLARQRGAGTVASAERRHQEENCASGPPRLRAEVVRGCVTASTCEPPSEVPLPSQPSPAGETALDLAWGSAWRRPLALPPACKHARMYTSDTLGSLPSTLALRSCAGTAGDRRQFAGRARLPCG